MEHLNITFPTNLREKLDREAKRQGTKRSTLIQKAVVVYLQLKEQQNTHNLLREGYQEMYGDMKQLSKEFEQLDKDSLKHVD